jgi:hypothetical protein
MFHEYNDPTVTEIGPDRRERERRTRELRRQQSLERKRRDRATRLDERVRHDKRLDALYALDVRELIAAGAIDGVWSV